MIHLLIMKNNHQ